ncbi:MAG: UDP kinase [Parcubacteria group bacterium]|nr:MAG: UDP kinase [Parcubacteria group bacterium]
MGALVRSFKHAIRGLATVIRTEKNFRWHLLIAAVVVAAAWYKGLSKERWVGLLIIMAFIMALEIFNSAIERLVDVLAPKTHSYAKDIKDLLAAMVLLVSIFAAVIGIIILL